LEESFLEEQKLMQGECHIKSVDDERFIYVQQNGRELHYSFERSDNGRFLVA